MTASKSRFLCYLLWCLASVSLVVSSSTSQFGLARKSHGLNQNGNQVASERWMSFRGGAGMVSGKIAIPKTISVPWKQPSSSQQQQATKEAKETMDAFLTRDSRNTFIARVYAILTVQMLVTSVAIYFFGTNDWVSQWMSTPGGMGAAVPGISLLLSTIAWFVMCGSTDARRRSPMKWQMLALFTLGEALSAGFLTSFFKFESVITAMLATATATSAISLYTATQRNSKYDLSQWGTTLTQGGLIFLFLGLIQLLEVLHVLPKGFLPLSEKAYCFFGASLFSLYIAHHTRTLVGGRHTKYQMNEKDYVFGAMTLYNDIISFFTYLLRIVGEDKE